MFTIAEIPFCVNIEINLSSFHNLAAYTRLNMLTWKHHPFVKCISLNNMITILRIQTVLSALSTAFTLSILVKIETLF